jgi:hypothetical protein
VRVTFRGLRVRSLPGLGVVAGLALGWVGGCSELLGPAPGAASPASAARDRPDDSNPAALAPDGVITMVDVNMAKLRGSPWTAAALAASDARGRAAKTEALGYDDVADVDRIIYAATAAGVEQPTLVIAQGRFQRQRVEDAFRARWPAATVDKHRQVVLLASGENSLAFLTARTFASGTPAAVRSVIDRAFGVAPPGASDGELGAIRRALIPEIVNGAVPAVLATVAIDQRMRARIGDDTMVPRELRRVGMRIDLGQSLDLVALGMLDNHDASAVLGRRLAELLTSPITRLSARAMGLGPLLDSARITVDGPRLRIRASASEESRADVVAALQTLMTSLRGGDGAGGLGSW